MQVADAEKCRTALTAASCTVQAPPVNREQVRGERSPQRRIELAGQPRLAASRKNGVAEAHEPQSVRYGCEAAATRRTRMRSCCVLLLVVLVPLLRRAPITSIESVVPSGWVPRLARFRRRMAGGCTAPLDAFDRPRRAARLRALEARHAKRADKTQPRHRHEGARAQTLEEGLVATLRHALVEGRLVGPGTQLVDAAICCGATRHVHLRHCKGTRLATVAHPHKGREYLSIVAILEQPSIMRLRAHGGGNAPEAPRGIQ